MMKTIALYVGAAVVALSLADARIAEAQFPTVVETTIPEPNWAETRESLERLGDARSRKRGRRQLPALTSN